MTNPPPSSLRGNKIFTVLLLLFFTAVLVRTAWVGDDAYITLRTVHNVTSGYGLSWNVDERVQSYTHPLWMVMMIPVYALSRDAYFTALCLSFAVTAATLLLIARERHAPLMLALLLFSKAFMDYSVSGLENPATHLLLLLFTLLLLKKDDPTPRDIFGMSLITALAILNRMDTALFFVPALAWLFFRRFSARTVAAMMLGFFPFALWEAFSLFYYGFPFPNTAYAKLGTGISRTDLVKQSLVYFTDSLSQDPLTLILPGISLLVVLWKCGYRERLVATGIILYLLYIVNIGGDFMSGRFFSAPYLVAVILLARIVGKIDVRWQVAIAGFALLVSLMAPHPSVIPAMHQPPYTEKNIETGINDERAFYYQNSGLIPYLRTDGQSLLDQRWVVESFRLRRIGVEVYEDYNIGFMGYYAGPDIHIIDRYALCDPLLARLPAIQNKKWRIGHFDRAMPEGYFGTIKTGKNQIKDPNLAAYYEKLAVIIRAPLGSPGRLRVIWDMNTGRYDDLLSGYRP